MVFVSATMFPAVLWLACNAPRPMRLFGPYAGAIIPRLLYVFLAAKAVAMVVGATVVVVRQSI